MFDVLRVQGPLPYRVLRWGFAEGAKDGAPPPIFLLHGFADAAASWDAVAEALVAGGHAVFALELRGYGDGPRLPEGLNYHFIDHVEDAARMIERVAATYRTAANPVHLVGHSMGGAIATYFGGAFPERLQSLTLLEGLGPPDTPIAAAPDRMRQWLSTTAETPKAMTRDDALRRLRRNHPRVDEEMLRSRLDALATTDGHAGDLIRWKMDSRQKGPSGAIFRADVLNEFAKRIRCPVLHVSGGPSGWHPPDEDARLSAFPNVARAEIADAGHMMHWTAPAKVAELIDAHVERSAPVP
jgi:pimeloyl-ACP methyl ester carboxylesterase